MEKVRLRVKWESGAWYAILLDRADNEVGRSPAGNEHEAEQYMANYRLFGAWTRS
jgi:hypothetical protein